jgi:hypothetical protein
MTQKEREKKVNDIATAITAFTNAGFNSLKQHKFNEARIMMNNVSFKASELADLIREIELSKDSEEVEKEDNVTEPETEDK